MLNIKSRDTDMINGRILPNYIKYTIPIIFTNLLQVSYNVADNIIVSYSPQPDAVGAVGTSSVFINLMINAFIGCSVGAKVLVANRIGANDTSSAKRAASTAIIMSIFLGILCCISGIAATTPVLMLMSNTGNLLKLAVKYTKIYFLGIPFIALSNFASAAIQAKGNTKTPLYIMAISGILNVFLNCIFVFFCKMSVEGVALASTISNAFSAFLLTLYEKNTFNIKLFEFKANKNDLIYILKVGLPAGIQGSVFSLSHILIQSSVITVNNLLTPPGAKYAPVVKGCTACASIESFASSITVSLGQSAISFVSQNMGAKKYNRVKKMRKTMYAVSFILSSSVAWAVILLKDPLLYLYGISPYGSQADILAYSSAVTRMLYMLIPYCFLGFMEVGAGVIQGFGRTIVATIITLTGSCLFRIIWLVTIFKINPSLEAIFIIFPVTWFITASAHYIYANMYIKNKC